MHIDSLYLALKYKRSAFSAALVKGLEQVEAKEKAKKDAGLDFDPIVNSQSPGDPGDSYVVGKVAHKGEACTVELYGVFSRKKTGKPLVMPELKIKHDRWIFTNFHYPNGTSKQNDNLLTLIPNYLTLH